MAHFHGQRHIKAGLSWDVKIELTDAELREVRLKTLRRVLQSIPKDKFPEFYARIEKDIAEMENPKPAA